MSQHLEHTSPASLEGPCFLVSVLLPADAFGTEPAATQPPPTLGFVDRFMAALCALPFVESMTTPFEEYARRADLYAHGVADPTVQNDVCRDLSLDLKMNLGGQKAARLFVYEVCPAPGGIVQIDLAFDLPAFPRSAETGLERGAEMLACRDLLLALCAACPVLIGTIGVELDAMIDGMSIAGLIHDRKLSRDEFLSLAREARFGHYEFMFVSAAAFGDTKPFLLDRIAPELSFPADNAPGACHDLLRYYDLVENDLLGRLAYRSMYESTSPKDDKDDALGYLAKAMELARALDQKRYEAELRERYEQIKAVYDAQFRR